MRSSFWLFSAVVAALVATPAQAQFAEEPYSDAAGATDPAVYTGEDYPAATPADPYADPYAADPYQDPYAAPPGTARTGSLRDRTVGDVATKILGANATQYVAEAEAVVRDVAGSKGTSPATPGASRSPLSVVRDLIAIGRNKGSDDPQ